MKRIPAMYRMFAKYGIDIRKEPILVYPTLHYQNGGLDITADGMTTNVENLFVAGFIGTPQMNFFDSTIEKVNDNIYFNLDCGTRVEVPYKIADKIPLKYMDNKAKVVLGLRPDAIRVRSDKFIDDGLWAPAKAVVSVVEVLGGETIVYANLNLDTPDATLGAVTLKADPDVFLKRGDIIDIEISKRKFHVFDKVTEKSIRRRIPEENIVKCNIENTEIKFEILMK